MQGGCLTALNNGTGVFGVIRQGLAMLLTVLLVLQPAYAHAQGLVAASPQTQVDVAPNGVPLVQLARPNAQGWSHNVMEHHNVERLGAIANNSSQPGQSQIGGYIGHNPNYPEGHPGATGILFDVVGTSRSMLEGVTEVFGRSADVVIANPNGITCKGCGFINTPRVTLGAGATVFGADGAFQGLDVQNGDVTVIGEIDTTKQDIFDLVGRRIDIQGTIHGNDMAMVAGKGHFSWQTRRGENRDPATGADRYAIDVASLGGLKAGQIFLASTDQGTGVRSAGVLAASTSELTLSSSGDLELAGKAEVKAEEAVHLTAQNIRATEESQIKSRSSTVIATAVQDVELSGTSQIKADSAITLKAENIRTFKGTRVTSLSGDVTATADRTISLGGTTHGGTVTASAQELTVGGVIEGRQTAALTGNDTLTLETGSHVEAADALTLEGGDITTRGDILAGDKKSTGTITVNGTAVDVGGVVNGHQMTITATEAATLSGSVAAQDTLEVTGRSVTVSGKAGAETMTLTAKKEDITISGAVVAKGTARLNAARTVTVTDRGQVKAEQSLHLNGTRVETAGTLTTGRHRPDSHLTLEGRDGISLGGVVNTDTLTATALHGALEVTGTVTAGGDVDLTGTETSLDGTVQGRAVTARATAGDLRVGGRVAASTTADLSAVQDLTVSGSLTAALNAALTATKDLRIGTDSQVEAEDSVTLEGRDVTALGTVVSGRNREAGVLKITGQRHVTLGGLLDGDTVRMRAKTGDLTLKGNPDPTQKNKLRATGDVTLTSQGDLKQEAGHQITSGGALALTATAGDMTLSGDTNAQSLTAQAGRDLTVAGRVEAEQQSALTAGRTMQVDGTVIAGTTAALTAQTGNLTLEAGSRLEAGETATLTAAQTVTTRGEILTGADKTASRLSVDGATVDVGGIVNSHTMAVTATGQATVGGEVIASERLDVNGARTALNGVINAGDLHATATTGDITVNGTVQTTRAVTLETARNVTVGGTVIAATTAELTAKGGDLSVTGTVSSGTSATLDAQGGDLTVAGLVQAGTTTTLTASENIQVSGTVQATTGQAELTAAQDVTVTKDAKVTVGDALSLEATAGTIDVAGTLNSDAATTVTAHQDITVTGTVTSGTSTTLRAAEALSLKDGSQITAGDTIELTGRTLTTAGLIKAGTDRDDSSITLTGQDGVTLGGQVEGHTFTATATEGSLQVEGQITAEEGATLEAKEGDLTVAGTVTAGTTADLKAHQALTLSSISQVEGGHSLTVVGKTIAAAGTVVTGRDREKSTLILTGQDGVTLGGTTAGHTVKATATNGHLDVTGAVTGKGDVTLTGHAVTLHKKVTGVTVEAIAEAGDVVVKRTGQVDVTAKARLKATGNMRVSGIVQQKNLPAHPSTALADQPTGLHLEAGRNLRVAAAVDADHNITLKAKNATVRANVDGQRTTINVDDRLTVAAGATVSGRTHVDIDADTARLPGTVKGRTVDLNLRTGGLTHTGTLEAAQSLTVTMAGDLTVKDGSTFASKGAMTIRAHKVRNERDITSVGPLTIHAQKIENQQAIVATDDVRLNSRSSIINTGVITSYDGQLHLSAPERIFNNYGKIYAWQNMSLGGANGTRAARIHNLSGIIESGSGADLTLRAQTFKNEDTHDGPLPTVMETTHDNNSQTAGIPRWGCPIGDGCDGDYWQDYDSVLDPRKGHEGKVAFYGNTNTINVRSWVEEPVLANPDGLRPATPQVVAGGNLNIYADTIINKRGLVQSAGNMYLSSARLQNVAQHGEAVWRIFVHGGTKMTRCYGDSKCTGFGNGGGTAEVDRWKVPLVYGRFYAGGSISGVVKEAIDNRSLRENHAISGAGGARNDVRRIRDVTFAERRAVLDIFDDFPVVTTSPLIRTGPVASRQLSFAAASRSTVDGTPVPSRFRTSSSGGMAASQAASPFADTSDEDLLRSTLQEHGFAGDFPNHPAEDADPPRFTSAPAATLARLVSARQDWASGAPPPTAPKVVPPKRPDPVSFERLKSRLKRAIPGFEAEFRFNPPNSQYIVESRFAYLDPQQYYGSDYFLKRLVGEGYKLETIPRQLGDAYFETTLVNQQLVYEQGKRWLDPTITSDAQQMKHLLDNGIRAAQNLDLAPGIALSHVQVNALKEDIVWYEKRLVAGQETLVPKVYLASSTRGTMPTQAASTQAHGGVNLRTARLTNTDGVIGSRSGGLTLTVDGDLVNTNGTLQSGGDMALEVGGNLVSQTTVRHTKHAGTTEFRDMEEGHARIESGGNLAIKTGGDVTLRATTTTAKGKAEIEAKGAVTLAANRLESNTEIRGKKATGNVHTVLHSTSDIRAGNGVSITSGTDLLAEGSQITTTEGDIRLDAGRSLTLAATGDEIEIKAEIRKKNSESDHHGYRQNWKPVTLNAKKGNVIIAANDDITLHGTRATADGDISVTSERGTVFLDALRDQSFESHSGKSDNNVWRSQYAKGHNRETITPVNFTAGNTVTVRGAGGVTLQVPKDESFDTTLAAIEHTPGLEWVAEAVAQGKVDVQALKAIRKEWDESAEGLSGPAAAVVGIAVSIATFGAGAAAIGASAAASIGSVGTAMINTAISTLASQASIGLINAKGNPVGAFKAVASKEGMRALAASVGTAGLLHGAAAGLDINLTMPSNVEAFSAEAFKHAAQETALRTVVDTAVSTGIYGQDIDDAVRGAVLSSVSHAAAQNVALGIGDLGVKLDIGEGDVRKALMHAAGGCVAGMLGGDCRAGAVAGFLTELTSPAVDALSDDPNVRGRVASTLAGAAILLTGGDVDDVQVAAQIGNTTRMYNRELHADERKILAGLTKNMSPQERRDTEDAALFLTHGHKGIADSNPRKQEIAARVAHGALQTDKIHLLKTAAPEKFDYSFQDRMLDQAAAYNEELGRLIGGAKVATGVAGMSASAAAVATVNAPTPLAVTSPLVTPLATAGFVGSAALVAEGQSELTANYSTVDQAQGVLDTLKPGYQGSAQQQVLDARAGQAIELGTEAVLPAAGAAARALRQVARPLAGMAGAGTAAIPRTVIPHTTTPLARDTTQTAVRTATPQAPDIKSKVLVGTRQSPEGLLAKGRPDFYVRSSGDIIPGTAYRATGGKSNIAELGSGKIASRDPTYITFDDIRGKTAEEVQDLLQLPQKPSHVVTFDTKKILESIRIPDGKWNTDKIPEPITKTFPQWGKGGGTQAVTNQVIDIDPKSIMELPQ